MIAITAFSTALRRGAYSICVALYLLCFAAPGFAQTAVQNSQAKWEQLYPGFLAAKDKDGLARFDYAALAGDSRAYNALGAYIAGLEAKTPSEMQTDEALAYWANLYNALTIRIVTDNYPVSSIRKIKSGKFSVGPFSKGPWKKPITRVQGQDLSLDDIEHGIMRKVYPSPFIHYMVNCASFSCPNLRPHLWRAKDLRAQQEEAARDYLSSARAAKILGGGRSLTLSKIYKWYEADFGGGRDGVRKHIHVYGTDQIKRAIEEGVAITAYSYDWSLNDVR